MATAVAKAEVYQPKLTREVPAVPTNSALPQVPPAGLRMDQTLTQVA